MTYYFFFLTEDEDKDGNKQGYAYAKANRDRWVQLDISANAVDTQYVSGEFQKDLLVYQDKVYRLKRNYHNLDDKFVLCICEPSLMGCDLKEYS